MQMIVCRFSEYNLPAKPTWLDRLSMAIAETIGAAGYREDKELALNMEHPDLFLIPGLKFSVSGDLIDREKEVTFILSKWHFQFDKTDGTVIHASVREIKPTPFARWFSALSQGAQYAMGFASIVLPLIIIGLGYYFLESYPEPGLFWTWFAGSVRGIVGWGLFIFVLITEIFLQYKSKNSPFIQNTLLALCSLLLIILPLVWLSVSVPPKPLSGNPAEAIRYLEFLRHKFITSSLLLVGIVPWITLFLKWFGFDLLASILSLMGKNRKAG